MNRLFSGWELSGVDHLSIGHAVHRDQQRREYRHFTHRQCGSLQRPRYRSVLSRCRDVLVCKPPNNHSQSFGPLTGQSLAVCRASRPDLWRCRPKLLEQSKPPELRYGRCCKHFKLSESSELNSAPSFSTFSITPSSGSTIPIIPGSSGNNIISCYAGPLYSAGFQGSGADCVTGARFLHPLDAHRPRTIQFGLKWGF